MDIKEIEKIAYDASKAFEELKTLKHIPRLQWARSNEGETWTDWSAFTGQYTAVVTVMSRTGRVEGSFARVFVLIGCESKKIVLYENRGQILGEDSLERARRIAEIVVFYDKMMRRDIENI